MKSMKKSNILQYFKGKVRFSTKNLPLSEVIFYHGKTGSGKTTDIIERVKNYIIDSAEDKLIVVSLASLNAVYYIYEKISVECKDICGVDILKQLLRIYVSESSQTKQLFCLKDKQDLPKVILTTHTYMKKRGLSHYAYPIILDLMWAKKQGRVLELLVDEGHLFMDNLVWSVKTAGFYETKKDLGGQIRSVPVSQEQTYNSKEWKFQDCEHQFFLSDKIRNPIIAWDNQKNYGLETYKWNSSWQKKLKRMHHVNYMMTKYILYMNPNFNVKALYLNLIEVHPPLKGEEELKMVRQETKDTGVSIKSIDTLTYESSVTRLFKTSPSYTETIQFLNEDNDNQGLTLFSGVDYESLITLLKVFTSIKFYSASFLKDHVDLWSWIQISVKEFTLSVKHGKDDYGCVILSGKRMTTTGLINLNKVSPLLHFCSSKKYHHNLESKSKVINEIRPLIASFNHVYRKEYETITFATTPLEIQTKPINLSYLGSSIATGTNIESIDIASVDLIYHIPFVFLPVEDFSDVDIEDYIDNNITEKIIQALSRVCRQKGTRFKILIINRTELLSKQFETEQESQKDLVQVILNRQSFKDKFKLFKKYRVTDINLDDVQEYMKHLLKDNKSLLSSSKELQCSEIWNIEKDVSNFMLEKELKSDSKQKFLPLTKRLMKMGQTDIKFEWYEKLKQFSIFIVNVIVSQNNFCVSFLDVKTLQIVYEFVFDELTESKEILDKFTFLNKNTILFTFGNLDKIGFISNRIYNIFNLQEALPGNKLHSIEAVGTHLKFEDLTFNLCDGGLVKHNRKYLNIINLLYQELFKEKNLEIYNEFLTSLTFLYSFTPTFDLVLQSFLLKPSQRWSNLYLKAMNRVSKGRNMFLKEISLQTGKILEFISSLKWNNESIKEMLRDLFQKKFYKQSSKSGFVLGETRESLTYDFKMGSVLLRLGSGGIHSQENFIQLERSSEDIILDMDIRGFYGTLLYNYRLLQDDMTNKLLRVCYSQREIALNTSDEAKANMFKFVVNSIIGNVGSEFSPIYDIQGRFDLIMFSQIILLNWIDYLQSINCEVFSVNTDGLIIQTKDHGVKERIKGWAKEINFSIKFEELKLFLRYSNTIIKLNLDGTYNTWGLNKHGEINNITSFKFNKPSIVKDIVENSLNDSEIENLLRNEPSKGIYTLQSSKTMKYYIINNKNEKKYVTFIRYMIGETTGVALFQEFSTDDKLISKSIIPLNSFDILKNYTIDIEYYKRLASISNESVSPKKIIPKIVFSTKILFSFWNVMKYAYEFIPVVNGRYLSGKLTSNVIRTFPWNLKMSGLALLINPEKYFIIDIDSSDNLSNEIKEYLIRNSEKYCFCYHNHQEMNLENVIRSKRFKIIFRSDFSIKNKLYSLVRLYSYSQIEIAFGKAYTIIGSHKEGNSNYFLSGSSLMKTNYPSKELISLLYKNKPNKPYQNYFLKTKYFHLKNITYNWTIKKINELRKRFGGYKTSLNNEHAIKLEMFCPNKGLHTSHSQNKDFNIKYNLKQQTLVASCYHNSCQDENRKLLTEHFKMDLPLLSTRNANTSMKSIPVKHTIVETPVVETPIVETKLKKFEKKDFKIRDLKTKFRQLKITIIANKESLANLTQTFLRIQNKIDVLEESPKDKTPQLQMYGERRTKIKLEIRELDIQNKADKKALNGCNSSLRYYKINSQELVKDLKKPSKEVKTSEKKVLKIRDLKTKFRQLKTTIIANEESLANLTQTFLRIQNRIDVLEESPKDKTPQLQMYGERRTKIKLEIRELDIQNKADKKALNGCNSSLRYYKINSQDLVKDLKKPSKEVKKPSKEVKTSEKKDLKIRDLKTKFRQLKIKIIANKESLANLTQTSQLEMYGEKQTKIKLEIKELDIQNKADKKALNACNSSLRYYKINSQDLVKDLKKPSKGVKKKE